MLSVKQGSIKYHFFSLWYDSTWVIGEHSNHFANVQYVKKKNTKQIVRIKKIIP